MIPDPSPAATGGVDVIVPVRGAAEAFTACAASLLCHTDLRRHRLRVVLDGAQSEAVETALARLAEQAAESLLTVRLPRRRGFAAAVNCAMAASDRDVVLLNSDTQVTPGWLDKLQAAAYSAPEIATATPFSNSATICSLPRWLETNALPAGWTIDRFGELVERVSRRLYPRLPTGVGVCLYIKRTALEEVGLFDERAFGFGYGEESEFCMRAARAGWWHVLDDATFIFHDGQRSFGASRKRRVSAAHRVLRRRHPEYLPEVARFLLADPLREVRERVLSELQPAARLGGVSARSVLHLLKGWPLNDPMGTVLQAAWLARRQSGWRNVAAYASMTDPHREQGDAVELMDGGVRVRLLVDNQSPRHSLSRHALRDRRLERDFARFLADTRPQVLHVHHLSGHVARLAKVAARQGVPIVVELEDWSLAWGPTPAPLFNRTLHAYRQRLARQVLRRADAVVAGSSFVARSYAARGWLPEDRITLVPYGAARASDIETVYDGLLARPGAW